MKHQHHDQDQDQDQDRQLPLQQQPQQASVTAVRQTITKTATTTTNNATVAKGTTSTTAATSNNSSSSIDPKTLYPFLEITSLSQLANYLQVPLRALACVELMTMSSPPPPVTAVGNR